MDKEIVGKNIAMLVSKAYNEAMCKESVGGNAGKYHAAVNAYINNKGEIVKFSNYPSDNPEHIRLTFSVDVGYVFPNANSKYKKPVIDRIFLDKKLDNEAMLNLKEAVAAVNKEV